MNNKQFEQSFNNLNGLYLDGLLEEISVQEIDEDLAIQNNVVGLIGWFGVVTDLGIIAYFGYDVEAYKFRLDYINRILNT
jgi:hypothetical protein